jgi:hypothetical protein
MGHEHSHIRWLQHRWNEEDAEHYEVERRAKQMFLEREATEIFTPIQNHLTRLDKVLRATGAAVEIDANWEHVDDLKLRRLANVRSNKSGQELALELTIHGATIFYREKPYRFLRGIEALIPVITSEVEQFLTSQTRPEHS